MGRLNYCEILELGSKADLSLMDLNVNILFL